MKEIINVHVKPGKQKFELTGFNEWNQSLEIKTKEKPVKGKANQEIEKELKKIFKTNTKIIQGKKTQNKKIMIENKTKKEIIELIKKNSNSIQP